MPKLRLESLATSDAFDLDSISTSGYGAEVLAGVTGFGLPPVTTQWSEGAGDGAVYRGRRVGVRDIDLPIDIYVPDRARLRTTLATASRMLAGPMRLWFIEDEGDRWFLDVYRVGGGTYSYGVDTNGIDFLNTVVTVRAGDPYWTSEVSDQRVISRGVTGRGLIEDVTPGNTGADSLVHLRLSSAQVQGSVLLENSGDAQAFPAWRIEGPGTDVVATGPTGDIWHWTGTLAEGDALNLDSRTARCVDDTGTNRYAEFAPAPRFWTVPPGISTANVVMTGTGRIVVSWQRRKWAVI